jgi:hypothetical protein
MMALCSKPFASIDSTNMAIGVDAFMSAIGLEALDMATANSVASQRIERKRRAAYEILVQNLLTRCRPARHQLWRFDFCRHRIR